MCELQALISQTSVPVVRWLVEPSTAMYLKNDGLCSGVYLLRPHKNVCNPQTLQRKIGMTAVLVTRYTSYPSGRWTIVFFQRTLFPSAVEGLVKQSLSSQTTSGTEYIGGVTDDILIQVIASCAERVLTEWVPNSPSARSYLSKGRYDPRGDADLAQRWGRDRAQRAAVFRGRVGAARQ